MTAITQPRLTIDRCENPAEWNAFIERYDGSPFALWGWGDAIEAYGHTRHFLVARNSEGIVGALPLVHVRSRLFDESLISLPFTSHGDLVTAPNHPETVKRRLLERAARLGDDLGVDYVSIRSTDLGEYQSFTRRSRYVSFHLPLEGGPDAVWRNIKSSRQRQITQASETDSLTYVVGDSIDDLEAYYQLYLRSMRGHGSPPHSFEFFRILWDRLHDDGHLRLGLIKKDGSVINGIIDLALGTTVVQKGLVADYDHRSLNGGSLLHWKSFEWACEAGYSTYDFGRTREGSGVYLFKKSFGGKKVALDDYYYFPNGSVPLRDAEDETYELPKRVWRNLPLSVTRTIGPHLRKGITL